MHQNDPDRDPCATRRCSARAFLRALGWASIVLSLGSASGWADAVPTADMLRPVQGLVRFMSTLPAGHPAVFARRGLCIIENFPPFLFCGPLAASRWEAGFRAHSRDEDLSQLATRFDTAYDFSESGDRAYFSLPTTWTGRTHGRPFEEHGAWSFVLARQGAGWRILGYGWGVTAYHEEGSGAAGS